ncbi:MAG: hypothetical protein OXT67_07395 [Zetaproteobacteria bacterium]|nr:hypothetical protein [Zetaproteobacteria bacterium]
MLRKMMIRSMLASTLLVSATQVVAAEDGVQKVMMVEPLEDQVRLDAGEINDYVAERLQEAVEEQAPPHKIEKLMRIQKDTQRLAKQDRRASIWGYATLALALPSWVLLAMGSPDSPDSLKSAQAWGLVGVLAMIGCKVVEAIQEVKPEALHKVLRQLNRLGGVRVKVRKPAPVYVAPATRPARDTPQVGLSYKLNNQKISLSF